MTIKSIRNFSIITAVLFSLSACNSSDDDAVTIKTISTTEAKYTFVKEPSTPGMVSFVNTSGNMDSYSWDFGDGTTSTVKNPTKTYSATGDYTVKLTAKNNTTGATSTYSSVVSVYVFAGGLVTNGNFENGNAGWFGNALNVVTESGNKYNAANVTATGNPYDVNLSQKGITITEGKTYRLTFDAWSDVNRSIIVGIGLSSDPWTNRTVTGNLTNSLKNFSIDLVANFSSTNSRVIFDMGAAVGRVNIDNVKLTLVP